MALTLRLLTAFSFPDQTGNSLPDFFILCVTPSRISLQQDLRKGGLFGRNWKLLPQPKVRQPEPPPYQTTPMSPKSGMDASCDKRGPFTRPNKGLDGLDNGLENDNPNLGDSDSELERFAPSPNKPNKEEHRYFLLLQKTNEVALSDASKSNDQMALGDVASRLTFCSRMYSGLRSEDAKLRTLYSKSLHSLKKALHLEKDWAKNALENQTLKLVERKRMLRRLRQASSRFSIWMQSTERRLIDSISSRKKPTTGTEKRYHARRSVTKNITFTSPTRSGGRKQCRTAQLQYKKRMERRSLDRLLSPKKLTFTMRTAA